MLLLKSNQTILFVPTKKYNKKLFASYRAFGYKSKFVKNIIITKIQKLPSVRQFEFLNAIIIFLTHSINAKIGDKFNTKDSLSHI
ncbi:MAG: Unknown protein [uncultured Campylobacterales bacterium]|uniref:Uncharacterized protein n=1 Tax=uncultured Campylobacterales bacterium TaxID=352960 RepID=A0A6S6T3H3_9BACT|nr:MAG: Unknown protein [uncultured Campylobacterales bacterium]